MVLLREIVGLLVLAEDRRVEQGQQDLVCGARTRWAELGLCFRVVLLLGVADEVGKLELL